MQRSQESNIHAPGGIQTHNPSMRAAAGPRLRPHGYCDQQSDTYVHADISVKPVNVS